MLSPAAAKLWAEHKAQMGFTSSLPAPPRSAAPPATLAPQQQKQPPVPVYPLAPEQEREDIFKVDVQPEQAASLRSGGDDWQWPQRETDYDLCYKPGIRAVMCVTKANEKELDAVFQAMAEIAKTEADSSTASLQWIDMEEPQAPVRPLIPIVEPPKSTRRPMKKDGKRGQRKQAQIRNDNTEPVDEAPEVVKLVPLPPSTLSCFGLNEEYTACLCSDPGTCTKGPACDMNALCHEGCQCQPGYVRKSGTPGAACVLQSMCPTVYECASLSNCGDCSAGGCVWQPEPWAEYHCKAKCSALTGSPCHMLPEQCPSPSVICSGNEQFTDCMCSKPDSCQKGAECSADVCEAGCMCLPGYVRKNTVSNAPCVLQAFCPSVQECGSYVNCARCTDNGCSWQPDPWTNQHCKRECSLDLHRTAEIHWPSTCLTEPARCPAPGTCQGQNEVWTDCVCSAEATCESKADCSQTCSSGCECLPNFRREHSGPFARCVSLDFCLDRPAPTPRPTMTPTRPATKFPTPNPSLNPTPNPTPRTTIDPTPRPSPNPTSRATFDPTPKPTSKPTLAHTSKPTTQPTPKPTSAPSSRTVVSSVGGARQGKGRINKRPRVSLPCPGDNEEWVDCECASPESCQKGPQCTGDCTPGCQCKPGFQRFHASASAPCVHAQYCPSGYVCSLYDTCELCTRNGCTFDPDAQFAPKCQQTCFSNNPACEVDWLKC